MNRTSSHSWPCCYDWSCRIKEPKCPYRDVCSAQATVELHCNLYRDLNLLKFSRSTETISILSARDAISPLPHSIYYIWCYGFTCCNLSVVFMSNDFGKDLNLFLSDNRKTVQTLTQFHLHRPCVFYRLRTPSEILHQSFPSQFDEFSFSFLRCSSVQVEPESATVSPVQ